MTTAADLRRSEIAMIKMAAKHLDMDDATYRAMLVLVTAKRSAADLDARERHRVIDHLKAKGWKPARSKIRPRPANEWAFVDTAAIDRQPLLRKIIMLARELGYTKASIETTGKRLGKGVQKLEFCDANLLRAIVGELNQQVLRIKARAAKA